MPVVLTRPSSVLPTATKYKILERKTRDGGEVVYVIQAQPPSVQGSGDECGSSESHGGVDTLAQPAPQHNASLSPSSQSSATEVVLVSVHEILHYVSPQQLENFEHYISRRPDLDPYLRWLQQGEGEGGSQPTTQSEQSQEQQDVPEKAKRVGLSQERPQPDKISTSVAAFDLWNAYNAQSGVDVKVSKKSKSSLMHPIVLDSPSSPEDIVSYVASVRLDAAD